MLLIELRHGNNAMLAFWEHLTFFFGLFRISRCSSVTFPDVFLLSLLDPKDGERQLLELCRAAWQLIPLGNI